MPGKEGSPRLELVQGGRAEPPLPRVLHMRDLEVRLVAPLGALGPGHYWTGHWMGAFERPVSIRLLRRSQARSWKQFVLRTVNLRHGACPEVYRFEAWGDYLCAVGELLPGASLEQWLAEGRSLNPRRRAALAWQLAAVLAWAHELGLAHGNLCPSLVWITAERYVKLLDWGVAGPGSAREDCQAYQRLCASLGAEPPGDWANMPEAVLAWERRNRRFSVYQRLP